MEVTLHPFRWWVPLLILCFGISLGAMLGAVTNIVNGPVCPEYFIFLMGWEDRVELRAIGQGSLEGGVLGLAFGIITSISFAASTRFRGTLGIAMRTLAVAVVVALICWVFGGIVAVVISRTWPAWYVRTFPVAQWSPRLTRVAWVGGSIWGGYGGSMVGALVSCIYQHRSWRKSCQQDRTRFEVLQRSN